jgi:hypothetical protein
MSKITIKKGSFVAECERSQFLGVQETSDGVHFTFKSRLTLTYDDPDFPPAMKRLLCDLNPSPSANVVFDLDNPLRPVQVNIPSPPEKKSEQNAASNSEEVS